PIGMAPRQRERARGLLAWRADSHSQREALSICGGALAPLLAHPRARRLIEQIELGMHNWAVGHVEYVVALHPSEANRAVGRNRELRHRAIAPRVGARRHAERWQRQWLNEFADAHQQLPHDARFPFE